MTPTFHFFTGRSLPHHRADLYLSRFPCVFVFDVFLLQKTAPPLNCSLSLDIPQFTTLLCFFSSPWASPSPSSVRHSNFFNAITRTCCPFFQGPMSSPLLRFRFCFFRPPGFTMWLFVAHLVPAPHSSGRTTLFLPHSLKHPSRKKSSRFPNFQLMSIFL